MTPMLVSRWERTMTVDQKYKELAQLKVIRTGATYRWERMWREAGYVLGLEHRPPEWNHLVEAEWVRSRPEIVQSVILAFPPACLVKAAPGRHFFIPAPGEIGQVVSYLEDGGVGVWDVGWQGFGPNKAQLLAQDLEVVAYAPGWRPEDVLAAMESNKEDQNVS